MHSLKTRYIELALRNKVLLFGQFTLKSGRVSPYFHNIGLIDTGAAMVELSALYAELILESQLNFDVLFGPAYKGIPLAAATAVALAQKGCDIPYAYNRKEAKDHGEGGCLVGAPLEGQVIMIDDVITAGTAYRQSQQLVIAAGASLPMVVVALDRQECIEGQSQTVIEQIEKDDQVVVKSLITFADLIEFVSQDSKLKQHIPAMLAYQSHYGLSSVVSDE